MNLQQIDLYLENKLKQNKTLELIVKLLIERKDTKIIKELTQIILDWVGEDKKFIEYTEEPLYYNDDDGQENISYYVIINYDRRLYGRRF